MYLPSLSRKVLSLYRRSLYLPLLIFFPAFLFLSSCVDMNVENRNVPDTKDLLATSRDVLDHAGEAFRLWNNAINSYTGPAPAMAVMADQSTCSWSSAAMADLSSEPRQVFNNDPSYAYAYITRLFWQQSYASLADVNDVLKRIDGEGMKIRDEEGKDVTGMVRAWCYFMQGVTHGYLALIFDKASVVDWDTPVTSADYLPYPRVAAAALRFFDKASATLEACGDFTLPASYIQGATLDKEALMRLINSFAARVMIYTPRTAAETAAVDWERVLTLARAGIVHDLNIRTDDDRWRDDLKLFGTYPGWMRIDHRIINLMDHDYPSRWPDDNVSWNTPDGSDPEEAHSDDARLASDFQYLSDNNFRPERGYYHFSHYRYSRYDPWLHEHWQGEVPTFLRWENDLMIAEALVRARHDLAGAAAILNAPDGARKARGGLPDVAPATDEEALETIFYERDVELILTQGGTSFFDMRRRDMLQAGTILHFPVPGSELQILGLPLFTTDGPHDRSRGCWQGYDGLISPPDTTCGK